jgi:DNA-binding Lrp family transcriptional regulator
MPKDPIDELDLKIIKALSENCTKPITQIAKEVKISRPTVMARIAKLRETGVIDCGAKVNVTKLGFKLASIHLEAKDQQSEEQIVTTITKCPRLLQLLQLTGKPVYVALVFTENTETLLSTIDCLSSAINAKTISYQRVIPLVNETFQLNIPEKNDITPCGKECGICIAYKQNECNGCPSNKAYKGIL